MTSIEKIAYAKKRINELEELIEYWGNTEKRNKNNEIEKI
tara:strand:+ start:1361 stop:1480 length:120 start_codon:yes stop_codon:yes gene_type:complete